MTGPRARDPQPGEEPEYSQHLAVLARRQAEREPVNVHADSCEVWRGQGPCDCGGALWTE